MAPATASDSLTASIASARLKILLEIAAYAIARGVKVIGYVSDGRSQADKLAISDGKGLGMRDGRPIDKNGHFVENFKHPVNLMLAKSCTEIVTGDMEKALALLWGHAV